MNLKNLIDNGAAPQKISVSPTYFVSAEVENIINCLGYRMYNSSKNKLWKPCSSL